MKLLAELQENETGTPIEFANAVINNYTDRARTGGTEQDWIRAEQALAEIVEHILIYLKYNSTVVGSLGVCCEKKDI